LWWPTRSTACSTAAGRPPRGWPAAPIDLLAAAGLEVLEDAPYDAFRHRVDQAIQRDILVARKPGRTA
jgi:hypothetical protein